MIYPLIIVGAGPAGLSASIYASRAGISTIVLEQGKCGGQLLWTEQIENYPGVPKISGKELALAFVRQAKDAGAIIEEGIEVLQITLENRIKHLKTSKGTWSAKALIVATGSSPKTLDVAGEKEFIGKGVSYCALCDAPFFKGKQVVVVGGGDSAVGESLYLAQYTEKIFLLHHKETLKAEWALQKMLKDNKKIEVFFDVEVKRIYGSHKVEFVEIQNKKTGETSNIKTDGIFVFIGSKPQTTFLKEFNILDQDGFVLADETTRTDIPGLFCAGEARHGSLKQIATSVGEGVCAALMAVKYLKGGLS
jgi:thioredoxin reductase (NADPH)